MTGGTSRQPTLIPLDSFAERCRASVYAPAPPLAQSSDGRASRNHGRRSRVCKREVSYSSSPDMALVQLPLTSWLVSPMYGMKLALAMSR